MNRPRVTIVTCDFPPVGGGAVMRMAKVAKYLPDLGWDVTVICSAEAAAVVIDQGLLDEIPRAVKVVTIKGPFRSIVGPAKRISGTSSSGGPRRMRRTREVARASAKSVLIPDRWLGWARRVSRLASEELGLPDVILSSGPPHSAHLAGRWLSLRHGVPLVMDLRDDWAHNPPAVFPAFWRAPIQRSLERRCIQRSSAVVHVSEASRTSLQLRYPRLAHRFHAITNGFDPDDLGAIPPRSPSPRGEPAKFLHAGSLRGNQIVGHFFEMFGSLARSQPGSLTLELLGEIDPHFRDAALRGADPGSLRLRTSVPHSDALAAMAESDVLVVFIGGGGAGADTMTGKLFEYLALRRPILLVGPPGPAADLVAGSGAGVVADPNDRAQLQAAISKVAALAADPSFAGAPDTVIARFDRRSLAARWATLLGEAVAASHGKS